MILRLPCAVANPTSIASTTNAAPPTVLFAPHHCRKTAALKANKIRNLFYFTEFLFFVAAYCYAIRRRLRLLPDGQYGYAIGAYCSAIRRSGYAYCPAGQYGYAIGAYCYAIRRSGYAYCPMGNTATQLAPIAAQYGARATPIARWAIRLRNWRLLLRNTALGSRLQCINDMNVNI